MTSSDLRDRTLVSVSVVLENDQTRGRIRCRHVVVPVNLFDLGIERAAHDEPHDELDALSACLQNVVVVVYPPVSGKCTGMVVVNDQRDIRIGLRHPLSSAFVAAKQRSPIGLTGLAMVHGGTDGRYM